MKLILHLGSAKTGSTSLQTSLDMARGKLAKKGILYPLVERRVPRRQNVLATPFQRNVQRVYANKTFKGLPAPEFAMGQWDRIAKQARNYDTVVISSEHLGSIRAVDKFGEFIRKKFPGAEVEAVYYVRRPSKHTASRMQQRISANHILNTFWPTDYFSIIQSWRKHFPVQLREFSPTKLHGGGISSDFVHATGLDVELTEVRKNESLSAEAMQILQDYRRQYYGDKPNQVTSDTNALKVFLKDMASEQGKKATLQSHIADTLDRMEFVHKLRDKYEFEFEDLDYSEGPVNAAVVEEIFTGTEVRNYMVFDEDRFRELNMEILHAMFAEKARPT